MPLMTLSFSSMAVTFLAHPSPGERYWTWQWSVQELRVTSIDPGVMGPSQSHPALDCYRDI
jgi:23S rRNA C2498 (ribose-2'-O)-methylase RlmM